MATQLIAILVAILPASGEEPKDDRLLGGKHPRFSASEGYALRRVIPLSELPLRIEFEPGKLSLVPDPTDSRGPYMVVYLVNATDQPVPRAVGENQDVGSQMRIGGHWLERDPMVYRCGSVPAPEDLPARHALALGARRASLGNIDGDIRYHFPAADVFSQPMRGRYELSQADGVLEIQTRSELLGIDFRYGVLRGRWDKTLITRDIEDFAAMLELIRHHQLCVAQRREIAAWTQDQRTRQDIPPDVTQAIARIEEVLGEAWVIHGEPQALVDRCLAALEAPAGEFGTPERCIGMVWRFLAYREMAGWSANDIHPESIARLMRLAESALVGSNRSARNGAALFLARVTDDETFPAERFHRFLESADPQMAEVGLIGLSHRERVEEAGPWLLSRQGDGTSKQCRYFQIFAGQMRGEWRDWEIEFVERLLSESPAEILSVLPEGHGSRRGSGLHTRWIEPLRNALRTEAVEPRRAWWSARSPESSGPGINIPDLISASGLAKGLRLLDSLKDSADNAIFLTYLDHPAAEVEVNHEGSRSRYFPAREAAKNILHSREVLPTSDIVTRMTLADESQNNASVPTPPDSAGRLPLILRVAAALAICAVFFRIGRRLHREET